MNRAVLLENYIRGYSDVPFDWDTANCCHFVAGWVQVVEGAELEVPGTLKLSLRRVMNVGTLKEEVTRVLKREPIAATLAQVGDVVLITDESVGAIGVCNGRRVAGRFITGVDYADLTDALCAWKIGDH